MPSKKTQNKVNEAKDKIENAKNELDDSQSILENDDFRNALNEVEKLLTQGNRAFLIGAGCSKVAGLPLTQELTPEILKEFKEGSVTKEILNRIIENFEGAEYSTIEDFMSEIVDQLAIIERRIDRNSSRKTIRLYEKDYTLENLKDTLLEIQQYIVKAISIPDIDLTTHLDFVDAIHRILQTGKGSFSKPADYFVLNYDTLLEDSLCLHKINYCDGFKGGVIGWWDINTFHNDAVEARVFKIHGSIDWCLVENDLLPRRIREPKNNCFKLKEKVLIWPASTKYTETQKDPFAQMLDLLRKSLHPTTTNPTVLTICGYRFYDSHINLEIEKALYESNNSLTLLVFTNQSEPRGILSKWHNDKRISEQVRIHAKKGFYHGDLKLKSQKDLNWWKFQALTKLIRGDR